MAKSAQKSVGAPFQPGIDPRRGKGPKKGAPNAGRPKGTYQDWLGELLDSPDHRSEFEAQITGQRSEKAFGFATRHAAAYKHGLPAQTIQGPDGGPVQVQLLNGPGLE